jgi:transposase
MEYKKVGKPVDISDINVQELEQWLNMNPTKMIVFKCQTIIALNRGVSMNKVCEVMDVTRETVRIWKGQLRREGLGGILKNGKVGKRSRLNPEKQSQLKALLKKSPKKTGYESNKWTGNLVKDYALQYWKLSISLRTANLWMKLAQ